VTDKELPYAEVIGDPVAHSKSPEIHRFWLQALGIAGDYLATPVRAAQVAAHLAQRRSDPMWRGCNVTAPLKQTVIPHLDRLDDSAGRIGAVNCMVRDETGLTGFNTDLDGVLHALANTNLRDGKVVIIGAGGAARAAIAAVSDVGASEIVILARHPGKAAALAPHVAQVLAMGQAGSAIRGAGAIINASPLGMAHAGPTPRHLLEALGTAAPGAVVLDMVYAPLETPLLAAARGAGLRPVDGLTMLIAQARRAFELFFGQSPSDRDDELRRLIAG
jgi:shikimate dehydrogenase